MPLSDRDYMRGKHPPACTCVDCVNKRMKKLGIKSHKPRTKTYHATKENRKPKPTTYHTDKTNPNREFHPVTDTQIKTGHQYSRTVNIISNLIISLIVIFALGLFGGGIYAAAKYHSNAFHWVSQEYHNTATGAENLKDKIVNSAANAYHSVSNSIQSAKEKALASLPTQTPKITLTPTTTIVTPQPTASPTPTSTVTRPSPTVTKTTSDINNIQTTERLTFNLINSERVKTGLPATVWDDNLYQLSKAHTQQMANQKQLFHSPMNDPIGEDAWGGYGYSRYSGNSLAQVIVDSWMSSPLHKAWILHIPIHHSVISIVSDANGQYASWTFWTSEAGAGPPLIQRAYNLWQAETGGNVPWLTWLYDIKGYPDNQEFLKQLGIK